MAYMTIEHKSFTVEFETPEIYVDNQARKRSGHMTHALAEFAPNCFIDFNSNCSANRRGGHSAYGWVEYRISRDGGKTYSDIKTLPYSVESILDGRWTVSAEKAVVCDDGSIVLFLLRNTMLTEGCCEPWLTPMYTRSTDQGETWEEVKELTPYRGRVYDAVYRDGVIYALEFCNKDFAGTDPEHLYRVFRSCDYGLTFEEHSVIPFDTLRRGYGSLLFDDKGRLHAYAYNEGAERYMDHAVSEDNGKTWTVVAPCYLDKAIRNPQTALFEGIYFLHGRSEGAMGFVFYTSENGYEWDEGILLAHNPKPIGCFYSNNIALRDEQGAFLMVQYSESYDGTDRVNVKHVKLRVKKH